MDAASQRRPLGKEATDRLLKRLQVAWGIEQHYWWPLSGPRPPHAECFQDHFFTRECSPETLHRILIAHGVSTLFEIPESDDGCSMDVTDLDPCYSGQECFWTDDKLDWIIYASHENSITVGGEWLLKEIKAVWPNWSERIWTTPFFGRPE